MGAVFTFDAAAVRALAPVVPHVADTASTDEREHRVQGDVPLALLSRVRLVGATYLLRGEGWLEGVYTCQPSARRAFARFDAFLAAVRGLTAQARAHRTAS